MKMNRGYTLIETVMVTGLFVILSGTLALFFLYFNRTLLFEEGSSNASIFAGSAVQDIQDYTILASQVLTSATINATTYTTGPTTLVLQVPALDSNKAIIQNTYDTIVYSLSGTTLSRRIAPGAGSARLSGTKLLSTGVTSLIFTYNNATPSLVTNVDTTLSVQTTIHGAAVTDSYHEQAYLRNYVAP